VLHVIELSWESGAVALLFCILYRRAACRRNFSFRASIILHLTVAAATTTAIATGLALHSNVVSRASRERTAIGLGERERMSKRERERRSHDDGRTGSSCTGTVFTFSVISTATQIGSLVRTAIRVCYTITFCNDKQYSIL